MGQFTPRHGLPVLVRFDNEHLPYETAEPIKYENEITSLTIPRGFELDFASIPRPLWWLWPKVGRYARAALVHDALYRKGDVSRVQADALLLAIMEQDGVRARDRWPIYLAVRLFGWIAWLRLRVAEDEDPQYDWRRPRPPKEKLPRDLSWPLLLGGIVAILALGSWALGQCPGGVCPMPPGGWSAPQPQPSAAPLVIPDAVRQAARSMVRVAHEEGGGVASLGSGVVVHHEEEASYVLTCAHLFTTPGRTFIRLGRDRIGASIVRLDRENDVTLLRVDRRLPLEAIPYAELDGGEVYAGGFGSDDRARLVGPQVLGETATGSVMISGQVRQGDSGGPVFNARGQVVGVVWGAAEGRTYAMHRGPVRAILARLFPRLEGSRPVLPILAPVPRAPASGSASTPPAPADPGPCRDALALREDLRALGQKVDALAGRVEEIAGREPPAFDDRALRAELEAHRSEAAAVQQEQQTLLERLRGRVEEVASSAAGAAKSFALSRLSELAVTSLGLGGPIGAGLWLGLRALRAARGRVGAGREAGPSGGFPG